MDDPIYDRAEVFFSARLFQRAFSKVKYSNGIPWFSGLWKLIKRAMIIEQEKLVTPF